MKVGVFSCNPFDEALFRAKNDHYGFDMEFLASSITPETVAIAKEFDAISVTLHDILDKSVLDTLLSYEIHHIALRCRGSRNIDLDYARALNIGVSRVPNYSAASVAEHSIALMLALNRKLHGSPIRPTDVHIPLERALGFNLRDKTVGVIGTGAIGLAVIKILMGFGSRVICNDIAHNDKVLELGVNYLPLTELLEQADIISLHCPLTTDSYHMIDQSGIQKMKSNVMLINTCTAQLIQPQAIIDGLKSQKIGYLGIDIFEMDALKDRRVKVSNSYTAEFYQRLTTFPNVLVTNHQGFFTDASMVKVIERTLLNLQYFFAGKVCSESFLS